MRKLKLGILSSFTILLILSGLALPARSQEEPSILWIKTFDGGSSDQARGVAIDSMGNIIVTGISIQGTPELQNCMTVKYDGNGNEIWHKTYGDGSLQSRSVAIDSQDNIVVAGYRFDGFTDSFLTVKYDKNGKMLWDKPYGEAMQGEGVAVDSQDNVIVVGYYYVLDMESAWDIKIIKYDSNGNEIWSGTYDDLEGEHAFDVAIDSKDNILITGASYDGMTHNFLTIKYDKDGNLLWTGTYNGGFEDEGHSVVVDSMDNVIVAGFTSDTTNRYFLTIKYDKDGTKMWTKTYRKEPQDEGHGVTVDSKDNIVVTGWSFDGTTRDLTTIKYDKDGNQLWTTSFEGSPMYGSLVEVRGYGVAVNSLNDIIVTGAIFYIIPQKLSDFLTMKLRAAIDNEPPEIEIFSPENKTYTTNSVPLAFAASEPASWIGYSLDNEANVTITGNTTLTDLSDGVHHVTVYASDASGNVGSSSTVYFSVSVPLLLHDVAVASVVPSLIEVLEGDPVNITVVIQNNGNYTETFNVTAYANNAVVQTQTVSNLAQATQNTLIFVWNTTGFSLGNYTIKAEASIVPGETNAANNIRVNGPVHIIPEVDNLPPVIEILSPESETYTVNSVVLTFTIDEPASWMTYSLDGEANVTIAGNTTLTGLSNGTHALTVYASDTSGNVGSSGTVHFTVSVPLPLLLHDVAVASVVPSLIEVLEGDPVNITVVVLNNGNYTETFSVTAYANNAVVQTQTVSNLAPASQDTLIFVWNTTGFSLGNYTIKAEASIVPGETHTADNTKINSTVHLTPKPPPSTLPLFIIAIILAVAATLFAIIVYRRRRSV